MKKLVIGILAHVDAGKTTLSEALLYRSGALARLGRVDHRDAFLDTEALERERGITIFSKQAVFALGEREVTLLDTPGHVDFSAEMERTLAVLDCAILVVSGTDGVQGHTHTLWRLLKQHRVPTFVFINKMDLSGADRAARLHELTERLGGGFVDFGAARDMLYENIALCDEKLLSRYLERGTVEEGEIASLVARCKVFPCFFGAALRLDGVDALLDGLSRYAHTPTYPDTFAAQVFKVSRDTQGNRLTFLKVTGGTVSVRDAVSYGGLQEKISQIRLYSGAKFRPIDRAEAGTICAVTGLTAAIPGMGLGAEQGATPAVLTPVLTYRMCLPPGADAHVLLQKLRQLEEEDPQLNLVWNEALGEIHVRLMGEVQLEILTRVIAERFGVRVTFDEGGVVYRETITDTVLGIGHFEPLRHYAEVQLLLEPGERGSGVQVATDCDADMLATSWQRLVCNHLQEREHPGVLLGAPITDVKVTLVAGRAHLKHTEGGDFRQATYRAVRQGLMQAHSVLLEPYYAFRLELPAGAVGRAMSDVQRMSGTFDPPEVQGDTAVLQGTVPVVTMRGYAAEVAAYTGGVGRLSLSPDGYRPCHNAEEVIAQVGYDPVRDTANPPDSVFCAHGAGYTVKWDEVAAHAHVQTDVLRPHTKELEPLPVQRSSGALSSFGDDKELLAIFERTYGPIKNRGMDALQSVRKLTIPNDSLPATRIRQDDYLLVDGYNIIFAWDELREMDDLNAARAALLDILSNFRAVRRCHIIVVFDAYKVKGGVGSLEKLYGLDVVYTKEAETADMYIEQASYDLSRQHRVRVATSDGLEQMIIFGHGAERLSATDLHWEVEQVRRQLGEIIHALDAR